MTYKIIGDSCLDLTAKLKKDSHFQTIPLTLQVGQTTVIDDESFNQKEFIQLMKNSQDCPKTACPSPERFKEAYTCPEENIFVICLSEHLSGSYNSAVLGKTLYEEEFGKKNIYVLSSHSVRDTRERTLVIAHCNCPSRARLVKEEMEKRGSFKEVIITETAGVATVYANDGGIVIAL